MIVNSTSSMINGLNSSYDAYAVKNKNLLNQQPASDVLLSNRLENQSAAKSASTVSDDDMLTLSGMVSDKIKMNVSTSMLAQANKLPSDVLKLLK